MTARSIRRALERKRAKEARKAAAQTTAPETTAAPAESKEFSATEASAETSPRTIANRANALLSTGARTPEGKFRSSLNALKTGLTGRTVLLRGDDAAEYASHVAGYEAHYQPIGQRERDLVQSIADTNWRLKRIPSLEYALFAKGQIAFRNREEDSPGEKLPADLLDPISELEAYLRFEKQLRNLHLQESRLHRRQSLDLAELDKLQTERRRHAQTELNEAAELYEATLETATPFDPAELGFEFSIPQIKRHIALRHARKSARTGAADPNSGPQEPSAFVSQAA